MAILAILLAALPVSEEKTEHYSILAEKLDATEVGRLLEGLHAHLTSHFGRSPKERLRVEIYSTRERWEAALRATGDAVPDAGGYYSPGTKTASLYVQPSRYYTRQLLLHEATHQFHFLVATGNRSPRASWYTEGLAEHFGMHDWDGEALKVGVVPAATLEDYPEAANRNFERIERDLAGIVSGKRECGRPEAWALVGFLMERDGMRFRTLASLLDRGSEPEPAWKRAVGAVSPRLVQEYEAWIESHAQPWKIVWTSWEQRGEFLEGESQTNGLLLRKGEPRSLAVDLHPQDGSWKAGLVFGYRSAEEFFLFQAVGSREVRVVERARGEWKVRLTRPVERSEGPWRLSAEAERGSVRLRAGETEVASFEAPGELGLNVEGCRIRFRVVE